MIIKPNSFKKISLVTNRLNQIKSKTITNINNILTSLVNDNNIQENSINFDNKVILPNNLNNKFNNLFLKTNSYIEFQDPKNKLIVIPEENKEIQSNIIDSTMPLKTGKKD